MATRTFVAAPLLDHEAEIHPAPSRDVLDRLAGPDASLAVGHALAVHELSHLDERPLRELVRDAAHDRGPVGHDGELARVDQVARSVAQAAIAERIVAAAPTILEEPSLHACHALAVEVPLQLGGQAQLAEQVPPRRSVELRAREVSPDPPMARADSAVGRRKQVPF